MSALAQLLLAISDFCCDVWYTFRPPADSWALLGIPYAFRTLGPVDLTPDDLVRPCPKCDRPPLVACRTATGRPARTTHKARHRDG